MTADGSHPLGTSGSGPDPTSPLPFAGGDGLLSPLCVCGHEHVTDRGEPTETCFECRCIELIERCQNCGDPCTGTSFVPGIREAACSRRCALQIEHLKEIYRG